MVTDGTEPLRDEDQDDNDFELSKEFVDEVSEALATSATARVRELVEPLHFSQIANLVQRLEADERRELVGAAKNIFDPQFLTDLDKPVRKEVIKALGRKRFARALAKLETDDAINLIQDVKRRKRKEILDLIPDLNRARILTGLAYPRDSAGRMMHPEVVAIPSGWTVGETIDHMRESKDLPDEFYDVFVIDGTQRPIGTLPLNRIMRTQRPVAVDEIMESEYLKTISVDEDKEDVAYLFRELDLVSAPVVDDEGKVIGTITVDDIVDVIEEEAEEDLMHLSGVSEGDLYLSILGTSRHRQRWLIITLFNTIVASLVISQFEATIAQIVALAVLMPIVAAMGGNAGMQVVTVTVRALATKEITAGNMLRQIWKEVRVGVINGVVFAAIMGSIAAFWFDDFLLGGVLAAAMFLNMVWSGIAGTLIPLTLSRMGVDPAIAAGPFLTTTTDVLGFFMFLGLATLILL